MWRLVLSIVVAGERQREARADDSRVGRATEEQRGREAARGWKRGRPVHLMDGAHWKRRRLPSIAMLRLPSSCHMGHDNRAAKRIVGVMKNASAVLSTFQRRGLGKHRHVAFDCCVPVLQCLVTDNQPSVHRNNRIAVGSNVEACVAAAAFSRMGVGIEPQSMSSREKTWISVRGGCMNYLYARRVCSPQPPPVGSSDPWHHTCCV